MKVRILSSIAGIAILAVVLAFFDSLLFVGVIGLISAAAVYELLFSTSYVTNKLLLYVSMIFSFITPFIYTSNLKQKIFVTFFVYVSVICLILIKNHQKISFQSCATAVAISLLVPSVFSVLILMRNSFPVEGLFFFFLVICAAWGSDTGAYFSGVLFGKHKLAPNISPKKTVEGYIGGLISSIIFYVIVALIFSKLIPATNPEVIAFNINYPLLIAIAPICSTAGVLGDLFASVIKRQTNIKDYGNIMPGHGGIMDRFDSVLFVSPMLFFIINVLPFSLVEVIK